jgi:hypothetical protein
VARSHALLQRVFGPFSSLKNRGGRPGFFCHGRVSKVEEGKVTGAVVARQLAIVDGTSAAMLLKSGS